MNKLHWTIVVVLVVAAAGRLWTLADTRRRSTELREFTELADAGRQVQQLMAAWEAGQLQDSRVTLRPSSMAQQASPLSPTWASLARCGVTEIRFQRLDPEAVVIVRPGPDGKPGIAGVDDRPNGIVDDPSELGATGSDDICRAETSAQAAADPGQLTLVLQRGAYIPANMAQAAAEDQPGRAIVVGQSSDGQHWSFMVRKRTTNVQ